MDGKVFLRGAPVCRVNDKGLKKYKYVEETNIRLEYKNGQVYILDYLSCKKRKIK